MLEQPVKFFAILFGETTPLWVQLWVGWMMLINTLSLAFIKKKLGQIVFIIWNINGISMVILFALNGYNRLLGLSHIIWWTPLFIYFLKIRNEPRTPRLFNLWFKLLFVTIGLTLILDFVDVARYFL